MIDLKGVKGAAEWPKTRAAIEAVVTETLGKLPKERIEPQIKVLDEQSFPGYVRKRISYFVDNWTRITAWLFEPENRMDVPGILCCHQTVAQGKDEPAGISGDPMLAFARHYAQLGYVTMAPDCITAGERVSIGLEPYDTATFYEDYPQMSAMGKMLWDHSVALDVMAGASHVDKERLGVIGHSLGAYNALFLAAFDERVEVCVASCGFTRFADDTNPQRWARDEGFIHFPELKKHIAAGSYPFDWEHILAVTAPTPVLLLTALNDDIFPNTQSCRKAVKAAQRVYSFLGEKDALSQYEHFEGHCVTPEGLREADEWFERWI